MLERVSKTLDSYYKGNLIRELYTIENNTSGYIFNDRFTSTIGFIEHFFKFPNEEDKEIVLAFLNIFIDDAMEYLQTYDKYLEILDCKSNDNNIELYKVFSQYTVLNSRREIILQFSLNYSLEDYTKIDLIMNVIVDGKNSATKLNIKENFIQQIKDTLKSIDEPPYIIF